MASDAPFHGLADARLLLVSGKGGVGKTSVAAALAAQAAADGKRVLLLSTDGRGDAAALFGRPAKGYEEVELAPSVHGLTAEFDSLLADFVHTIAPVGFVASRILSSATFRYFTRATPGLADLLLLGKVREIFREKKPRYDLVVMDAPATGHAISLVSMPRTVLRVVPAGPIHHVASDLDALFSDERVTVDTANFNAARIWKLYGTVSRKGDSTPERPHRRSRILSAPDELSVVTPDQLRDLAARLPTEQHAQAQPASVKGKGFDLCTWLSDHGIRVRSEKPYSGGTLFILDQCPFSSAHKDGAFAIQFGNGAVFAGCKHTSCGGGTQRWQELRERFEPDRAAKRRDWEQKQQTTRKDRARAKAEQEGRTDPGPVPVVAFNAHLDTSPETSGAHVRPQVVRDYPGGDLVLPGDPAKVIRVADNPELEDLRGCTLITSDGTTLLGADDKAGVAIIMESAASVSRPPV